MQARTGRQTFSTNARFIFFGSPSSKLPFHIFLVMVQPLYRATGGSECVQISTGGPAMRYTIRCSLQARTGRWAFSTNARLTFLGSPSSKLPFHIHLALVQPLYRATGSSECVQNYSGGPIRRCTRRSSLRARTGWCSICTTGRFTFLGSPSSKLPFHTHLELVQPWYRTQVAPNMCKFPLAALHGAARYAAVCRPQQEGGLFPPTQG